VYAGITYTDLQNKTFEGQIILPKYTFSRDLYYGLTNDSDVKKLQEVLKIMGYFPNIEPTGNYFGVTVNAVMEFQLKTGIITTKTEQGAGRCGPLTRAELNKILNQ
jgi:peptidoglycan hydrolase-like protein with peptidoglycan-binding domain